MAWHWRDASRLREVRIRDPPNRRPSVIPSGNAAVEREGYWEGVAELLSHLRVKAPGLRSLDLIPPARLSKGRDPRQPFDVLPLVGALIRLRSLTLQRWACSENDVSDLFHLTGLQNLEVAPPPPPISTPTNSSGMPRQLCANVVATLPFFGLQYDLLPPLCTWCCVELRGDLLHPESMPHLLFVPVLTG